MDTKKDSIDFENGIKKMEENIKKMDDLIKQLNDVCTDQKSEIDKLQKRYSDSESEIEEYKKTIDILKKDLREEKKKSPEKIIKKILGPLTELYPKREENEGIDELFEGLKACGVVFIVPDKNAKYDSKKHHIADHENTKNSDEDFRISRTVKIGCEFGKEIIPAEVIQFRYANDES